MDTHQQCVHMGLWSGDYTNLLPQFITWLKVCPGEGLMRFETRLQPWQTPYRSWVLHGTRWETYTDARSGIVLCFHLFKHKQENANMMSSYRTVQISVFCVMIVVFHGTGNKKLHSDHDVKIYLIALIIFRLLLLYQGCCYHVWPWTTKPLKCNFFAIAIYTSSKRWLNKLSIDVWFVRIVQYLAEI